MASADIHLPGRESRLWLNACTACGTSNPTRAGVRPTSCVGCGANPVPVIGADVIDWSVWSQSPEDRRHQDTAARAGRAKRQEERAERAARLARAALAMKQHAKKLHDT